MINLMTEWRVPFFFHGPRDTSLVEERCAKVDHWKNSSQCQRWLATALADIEPRLRKVTGYRHLPKLREALKREPKLETTTASKRKVA